MMIKYTTTHMFSVGTLLLMAFAGALSNDSDTQLKQQNLDTNEAKWDTLIGGDTSCGYVMKFRRICFCPPEYLGPFQVVVNSTEEVASAIYLNSTTSAGDLAGTPADPDDTWLITIEDAFDTVQEAINQNAHRVDVTYHPTMGYPSAVSIDYDVMIADEEVYFWIEDVVPL